MVRLINPKVSVLDYGPKVQDKNGKVIITPDEIVYGAAGITYKDIGTLQELIELKKDNADVADKMTKSLIRSAGAGHASMATTPLLWVFLEGNCSKLVDSIFTGARFSSSLMPSSRRVPIALDQIVIPPAVHANPEAAAMYIQRSEANINLYCQLQTEGVPKEEAAKIVQYGHRGGGLIALPLETLIYFAKEIDSNPQMPREAGQITRVLEDFVHSHGMGVTYEARKNAPREGAVNPNIFSERKNLAQELIEDDFRGVIDSPVILEANDFSHNLSRKEEFAPVYGRDLRIRKYLERKNSAFSSPDALQKNWRGLMRELQGIIEDYNDSVSVVTAANSPWRVWGEVKRHRTLGQQVESVYNAVRRAAANIQKIQDQKITSERAVEVFGENVSIPPAVRKNPQLLDDWLSAFTDSIRVYQELTTGGIPASDAICVVPRGLKVGIVKKYDLANLTTGYMSLRLCNTAEAEMRRTTEQEMALVLNSSAVSPDVKSLIAPKCFYSGFCPEGDYKRCCGKVKQVTPFYDETFHNTMQKFREAEIITRINSQK